MKGIDIKKEENKNPEMMQCARCGVTAPVGFDEESVVKDEIYEFILPNEKVPLCCNCIALLATKVENLLTIDDDSQDDTGTELRYGDVSIRLVPATASNSNFQETKLIPKAKVVNRRLPLITKVEKEILSYILGQDEHVRNILTAIYKGRIRPEMKSNMLVVGKSGTGKTETIKQIARILDIPYTIEDATQYTEQGYYGASVEDMVTNLIDNAGGDIEKAKNGILIIDEIDKKAGAEDIGRDVSGAGVIKSMLKIVEGTIIKYSPDGYEEYDFDTSNLIVIFMGAFQGLDDIRKKRNKNNTLGFSSGSVNKVAEGKSRLNEARYVKQDFIKYGFTEEFMGRINHIEEMNNLTIENLERIVSNSKCSEFKKYLKWFREMGIKLTYPTDIYSAIAKETLSYDTGARELANVVNEMFEKIVYQVLANSGKYSSCKITTEILKDNTKYMLK